jgi:hypothetical protein
LERELSPDRTRGTSNERDEDGNLIKKPVDEKTTEQLIHEMTLNEEDEEDRQEAIKNETLPGSCKSKYALQFRFQTD